MTIMAKQSARKRKSIIYLVEKGEYSLGYALLKVEELYDNGKLTDDDYDYLATWIEDLLEEEEKAAENNVENTAENAEETPVEEVIKEDTPEE